MTISDQELSELKSRVLIAMRTRTNIARVDDIIMGLIREASSYLPERAKGDTDTEYLYSIILAIESNRANPTKVKKAAPEPEPAVEEVPEITTVEEVDSDSQWPEPAEDSAPDQAEATTKKSGKQPKRGRK